MFLNDTTTRVKVLNSINDTWMIAIEASVLAKNVGYQMNVFLQYITFNICISLVSSTRHAYAQKSISTKAMPFRKI